MRFCFGVLCRLWPDGRRHSIGDDLAYCLQLKMSSEDMCVDIQQGIPSRVPPFGLTWQGIRSLDPEDSGGPRNLSDDTRGPMAGT